MRSQTSSGRQNYHQILTEVELRNLSAPCMKRKDGLQRVKQNQLQNLLKQTMTLTSSQKVSKVVFQENQGHFLEDDIFTKHVSQITPPAMRSRKRSTDLRMVIASPLLPPPLIELNTPATKTNGISEFYNLLYVSNGNKDHSIVPPSRWATFD